jgi:hypothetical protein
LDGAVVDVLDRPGLRAAPISHLREAPMSARLAPRRHWLS